MAQQENSTGKVFERTVEISPTQSAHLFRNGYSALHNNHTTPFIIDKIRYRSVEQYVQAQKALLFRDYMAYQGILLETSAQKCKDYRVTNFDHETWKKARADIIRMGLEAKFSQNKQAREKLASTGSSTIIFASHYDRVLGTGLELDDDRNLLPESWEGWNELGQMIEGVREKMNH